MRVDRRYNSILLILSYFKNDYVIYLYMQFVEGEKSVKSNFTNENKRLRSFSLDRV
jgi:hypothetical protein